MSNWKEEFDKEFPDPMTQKYGQGFKLYCSFCSTKGREEQKSFISTEIIEKLIEDIPEWIGPNFYEQDLRPTKQHLRAKWLN